MKRYVRSGLLILAALLSSIALAKEQSLSISEGSSVSKGSRWLTAQRALSSLSESPPSRLGELICNIQHKIRWRQEAWTVDKCAAVAAAYLEQESLTGVPASLGLAVGINESDLREDATRITLGYVNGVQVAVSIDGGIMGVHCVLQQPSRKVCSNGRLKGMTPTQVFQTENNIRLGMAELAHWKSRHSCKSPRHPYFAHYNWGPKVFETGRPRAYPHRVGVLYHAIEQVLGSSAPEIQGVQYPVGPGERPRVSDRPVGIRQRRLYNLILACASA